MSVETASGALSIKRQGTPERTSIGEPARSPCIDCAAHESLLRRRTLALLLGALGLVALALAGERRRARDRRQGGPADPGVAVQLDRGDRAGRLVRGALDAVEDARSCRSRACAGCSLLPAAGGMAREPDRRGAVRARPLQRLRRRAGDAGELLGDVHLRHLLGRHARRERAVRRRVQRVQPVAHVRARARGARARCCAEDGRRGPPLRYPKWLGVWPAVAGIVGFAWLELVYIETRPARRRSRRCRSAYFLAMLVGMALFGVEEWSTQADGFGVYFNLLSKLSALVRGRGSARSICAGRSAASPTCRSARARSR